jgi:hypothetical protein
MIKRLEKAGALLLMFGNGVFYNIENIPTAKDNLKANLKDPIGRVAYGWKYDDDSFKTNFIEHPVLWFSYATYLKSQGASDKETFITTQVANVLWEGVMEGTYVPPSGKDLVTDLVFSSLGIYMYNKGPGKALANKFLQVEKWGANHDLALKPLFSYNAYTRSAQVGSKLLIYIR